jgi:alpha-L-rhamnosidase
LYITGLGLYRAYINNNRVGNYYLTPGFNDYDAYLRYQVYDIKNLLKQNENNKIEVHMGDGWYKSRYGIANDYGKQDEIWGNEYKLCAKIIIVYNNGEIKEFSTDDTWKVKKSHEVNNGIYDGEQIDYTIDNGNEEEVIISTETYKLVPDFSSPIVEKDILKPELYISPKNEKILDFKQNMVGFVRYKKILEKNKELKLTFGEVLQNKTFYNGNYRSAKPILIFKGDGTKKDLEPQFTFFGFRYALVEGLSNVDSKDFEGVVIYTDLERTIKCETGSKKINKLISNTFWSQRSNFLDVPTDCPQRDERLGWTGDVQVFSNTACYNMDAYNFYKKYIKDLREDQQLYYDGDFPMWCPSLKRQCDSGGAVWADVGTIVPWNLYMNYGDKNLLKKYYHMVKDYVTVLENKDKKQGDKHLILEGFTYGDWLALDGIIETGSTGGTNNGYIMSIYYYVSVDIASKMAKELGNTEDENKYNELKKNIYDAILNMFYAPSGKLTVDTQTAYILALHYKIYRNKEIILSDYKERIMMDMYKLKTGFTGTPLFLLTLFDNGLDIDAYRFLFNQKFPGWLYAVNLGATTIWERWNSLLEDGSILGTGMNSLNHYAYGSVCEAIYSRIVGLKNMSPGWKKVLIQPHINYRLRKVDFSYNSISGKIEISWNFNNESDFNMNVTIPNGVEADIILPDDSKIESVKKGTYHYNCKLKETIFNPYTVDTPLFEIMENEEAAKIISQDLPKVYYMMIGDNQEMKYGSIRTMVGQPFLGVTEDQLEKLQKKLSKIKINPEDDEGGDDDDEGSDTTVPSDDNISNILKFNIIISGLLILF